MTVVWEYQTVAVVAGIAGDTNWEEKLNAAGQDGWEAVGVVPLSAAFQSFLSDHTPQSMSNMRFAVLLKRPR
ncbi:hypothetical protein [Streptomyces telluris]|uniref:DUF4177 domain-containing protein n=1 Tax=Streptomyces telluris TaxID=2720021 RepID=A0A9X2RMN9_9ACTN|nr:hypothetical protein [Streptomyces telluris]MCQ8770969.1 hypothetical protein [Streptomyces telluris]NJP75749.1 hypothetical protein [Streptomyces telluris]